MTAPFRFFLFVLLAVPLILSAAEYPSPTENDYIIRDFKFTSGETMPELKIHYRTIGKSSEGRKGRRFVTPS